MSALDSIFLPLVTTLLNGNGTPGSGFGTPATLIKSKVGYIPELDLDSPAPPTSYPINITPPDTFTVKDQYGTTTRSKNLSAMMPGLLYDANGNVLYDSDGDPIVPEVGDKVTFNGTTYRLAVVNPIMSGAVTAAWQLTLGA